MTNPIPFSRFNGFRSLLSVAFGVFIASAFFFAAQGASAATITVDSLGNTGGAGCELREAITSANANSAGTTGCTAGAGTDTIVFSVSGTIDLNTASGTLTTITSAMIINGGSNITIDANAAGANRRIFSITAATSVTMMNIILREGRSTSTGGCINDAAATILTLRSVSLIQCAATGLGGAIQHPDDSSGVGSVNLIDVTLANNSSTSNGGAVAIGDNVTLRASSLTATGNRAGTPNVPLEGSVIYYNNYSVNNSFVSVTGTSYFAYNTSSAGAIYIRFNDNHLIDGATFEYNTAGRLSPNIQGAGAGIEILGGASVTVRNSIFRNNTSFFDGTGAAIELSDGILAIEDTLFEGNIAPYGAAIHTVYGTMSITRSTFLNNIANDEGGALYFSSNDPDPGANVLITNSHFEGNVASVDGGGAIRNRRGIVTLYNNTFYGNSTPGLGAVFLSGDASTSSAMIANNIFDANTSGDGNVCAVGPNSTFTSLGNNLSNDATPGCNTVGTDILGVSANLGPLGLHGATTTNRLPLTGSPAIDAANATYAPAVDQRNISRPQGLADDIGSTELNSDTDAPIVTQVTPVATSTNDTTPNYTFNTTEDGTIIYGGSCSSATTAASSGNNTITFNALAQGTYSNCTISVSDSSFNTSTPLAVRTFTVDTTAPTLAQVTRVPTSTSDTTPNYTFSSTEIGSIVYGGSCSSVTTSTTAGSNTITFNALAQGTYSNCTITVSDAAFNTSTALAVSTFTVDTAAPTLAEVTRVPTSTSDTTPNYTFSSSEIGSIVYGGSCSSATTSTTAGSNTITFNTLAEGTYSNCTITVSDAAFNTSTALTVSTFTVDVTAPVLAQVTPVPTPTNDSTPNYTFSSTQVGTIIYGGSCSAAATSTTIGNNTITFNTLSNGTYANCTISVSDAAFNTSTPLAVSTFTVDTGVPTLAEVTRVPAWTNDTTPNYTFSSSEVGTITYGGSCSSATSAAGAGNNTITFNTLTDGTYSDCTITVSDTAHNTSTALSVFTFRVDTVIPSLTEITRVPTSTRDTTPNYTFSSTEGGSITYGGSCSSATTSTAGGSQTITLNALADGTYSDCTIRVSDLASNTSSALTLSSFTIDTTSSTLAEVTPVPTPTNDQTPNYTFSSTDAGTIVYGGSCSSAMTSATSGNNTITFSSLAAGTYSNCTISVVDGAFNTSTALSVTAFTIDVTAPTLAEVTPVITPTTDNTPAYTFSSNEAGTISYGGSCSSATTAASSGSNSINFSTLADGTYTNCTITVTDAAGNASAALDVSDFIVDTTGPVITLLGSTPVEVIVGNTYTDAGATALDARDGDVTSDILTVNSVNTSTIGTYTVTYDVVDSLGNAAVQVVRTVNVVAEQQQNNGGGSSNGGGGLSASGGSSLPPPVTTYQTSDSGRPQRLEALQTLNIPVHGLIKLADDGNANTQDDAAVYYVGADGRRHAFPNAAVYFTWYNDFSQVQIVDLTKLASVPLGSNVTYKPGVKMVKFTTDPKVYAVEKGGVLRWISSEPVAILLYGPMWNMNIDDVNDAFFTNYRFGATINGLSDFNPAAVRASVNVPSDSLEM